MSIIHYDTPGQSFYAKFSNSGGSYDFSVDISDSGRYLLEDSVLAASGLPPRFYDVVVREGTAISGSNTDSPVLYRSFQWNGTNEVGLVLNDNGELLSIDRNEVHVTNWRSSPNFSSVAGSAQNKNQIIFNPVGNQTETAER